MTLACGLVLAHAAAGASSAQLLCNGRVVTIVGSRGSDRLTGTDGPDVVVGLGGNDTILGNGGNDVICGGAGADILLGGSGADRISGGAGDDLMAGETGLNMLLGGSGWDSCSQNSGAGPLQNCESSIARAETLRLGVPLRKPSGRSYWPRPSATGFRAVTWCDWCPVVPRRA